MADKGVATGTQRAPVVTVEMQLARLRNLTDLLKQAGITGQSPGQVSSPRPRRLGRRRGRTTSTTT